MNVEEVQRRLWEQSKTHRRSRESSLPLFPTNRYDNRIRNLSDLLHHPDWLNQATMRTLRRSRGKACGVDGVTVSRFEQNLDHNLDKLLKELKKRTYRPEPLRRVEIPKPNGKVRLLGIPCLRDKIVQEAIRMQLEPIYEVEFHNSSFGFRPNRNAHHAIFSCRQMLQNGYTWVIEGDVKACFDEISHKAILAAVREKVMDNKFLDVLRLFLKAGVVIDGQLHPTNEGVPQGGVVSPLLANAVLNKLDWFLHSKGEHNNNMKYAYKRGEPNVRFVRYADDWCVFITRGSKHFAETLREEIREFLATTSGLRLSEEKTHVTHVRDGFNFLGFHLRKGTGKNQKLVPKVKIGQKAKLDIQRRLCEAIRYRPAQESIASRMVRASAIIRGWSNYFRIAHNYSAVASTLDHTTFWTIVKAICLKSDITTAQCIKKYKFQGSLGISSSLSRFVSTRWNS